MKKNLFTGFFAIAIIAMLALSSNAFAKDTKVKEAQIKTNAYSWMNKNEIESNLKMLNGIKEAELDLDTKIVAVTYDPETINVDKMIKSITDLGYEPTLITSDNPNKANTTTSDNKPKSGTN